MEIVCNIHLCDFEFWAGARQLARHLTCSEFALIEDFLSDTQDNLTDTDINDIFWFQPDFIVEDILGYTSYDEFLVSREE